MLSKHIFSLCFSFDELIEAYNEDEALSLAIRLIKQERDFSLNLLEDLDIVDEDLDNRVVVDQQGSATYQELHTLRPKLAQRRKKDLKRTGLAKLTQDEKEALGLK